MGKKNFVKKVKYYALVIQLLGVSFRIEEIEIEI